MILCAWDYRSGPIFRRRSQCDVKTPSDSVSEAAVHKKSKAIQHLLASTLTQPNFLASESFSWLVESLPMILPLLLAFVTNFQQLMPPIGNLQKFSLFYRHAGPRHQNHRS